MRFTNFALSTALAAIVSLGICACHGNGDGKSKAERTSLERATSLPAQQTGSNLPRREYVSEETKREDERREREKKEKKKKLSAEKKKRKAAKKGEPVDEEYVPRGGFR